MTNEPQRTSAGRLVFVVHRKSGLIVMWSLVADYKCLLDWYLFESC